MTKLFLVLGVPVGIMVSREMNQEEVRKKTQYSWTWSIRLDQNFQNRIMCSNFLMHLNPVKLWEESLYVTIFIIKVLGPATSKFPCKLPCCSKVPETCIARMNFIDWETVPRAGNWRGRTYNEHKDGIYSWRMQGIYGLFHKDDFYSLRDKAQDQCLNNSQNLGEIQVEAGS